ncbi:MAG TPA: uroporphyrinogen decarboxylase family protein [bacterium]|nr:uroporphyrinogen decarboxylase family protein [bacterium]HOL35599.1 uroporphyrinogen decarboxylase family protein [bacterium]HPP08815.1 uroporphyrinogen decarboxylase family protein [bacterium]
MTKRQIVIDAINHRQVPEVPYVISFTHRVKLQMAQYYNDPEFDKKLGNYLYFCDWLKEGLWKEVEPDIWEDYFGVRWNRKIDKDIGTVCNQVFSPENISEYKFPDLEDIFDADKLVQSIKNNNEQCFCLASLGFSLFERAWTMIGMENLLVAMVNNKRFVHTLFDRIVEFNLKILDKLCSFPIDGVIIGDDWGQQTGLIMGPHFWHEFIEPRIRQMYATVKSHKKYVFIHSCGKVDELFSSLIEAGLDVFNPFQPEVMDVFEIKRKYGKHLSFYGGISTQKLLPYGTVEETKSQVKKLLNEIGKDGGYIAAPAHSIPYGAKPENIAAMIEVLQNQ